MLNEQDDRLYVGLKIDEAINTLGKGGKAHCAKICGVTPQAVSQWVQTGQVAFLNLAKIAVETKRTLDYFSPYHTSALGGVINEIKPGCQALKNKAGERALILINEMADFDREKWLEQGRVYAENHQQHIQSYENQKQAVKNE